MKVSRTPGPETSAARRDNPAVLKSTARTWAPCVIRRWVIAVPRSPLAPVTMMFFPEKSMRLSFSNGMRTRGGHQERGGLSPTPESGRPGRGKTRGSLARTWRISFWGNARRRRCRAAPRGSVGSGVEDFGQALADDHARRMGVARGDGRHDRAVSDAEFFHAVDP